MTCDLILAIRPEKHDPVALESLTIIFREKIKEQNVAYLY